MPRFFTNNINENHAYITDDDAKHISKVLRMKKGESITICDTKGTDYFGIIEYMDTESVCVLISEKQKSKSEPSVNVKLYMALPKGDKMEFIIQKSVELGVTEIVPIISKRCVSRPNEKAMDKKIMRYNKIAYEASKQSGRGIIPKVLDSMSFKNAIIEMKKSQNAIMFYENADISFKKAVSENDTEISIMIGSEGGFSEEEVAFAKENNIKIISLGNRILRCETAPLTALSVIMFQTGNM